MRFSWRSFVALVVCLWCLAPLVCRAEAPEKVLGNALTSTLSEAVPQLKDHYFSYVIGIDTSGSYADSNKMAFTKLALADYFSTHLVPGEAVYVFAFGPRPYDVMEGDFFKIPSDNLSEARSAVQNLNGEVSRAIQRNPERGTDVNYAFSHGLDMATSAPNKNCLVMLFTDAYNEEAKWSRDANNLRQLKTQLARFGGKDLTTELEHGYHMRYTFSVKDERRMQLPTAMPSASPGGDVRSTLNGAMNASPSPSAAVGASGVSGASAATGPSGASGSTAASPEPSPSPSPDAGEESSGPPWLFLLVLLALIVGIGFALTRPLPITVVAAHQKPAYLPLNQPFTIGGPPNDTLADLAMTLPNEPIAQFVHVFPRRLRASHLKSGTQSRLTTDDGQDVSDVPVVVETEAEVSWTDKQTGKPYTLRVVKGKPTTDAEKDGDDNNV